MGLHRSSIINWYRKSIDFFLISGLGVKEQWHGLQDHQTPNTLFGLSGVLLKVVPVSLNYTHQKIWRHVSHCPVRKLTICFHKFIRSVDIAEPLVGFNFLIIIIRHDLGLDRPVSASSNNFVKGLSSRLRQLGLQFSIIFVILSLFILVTCRSQFHLLSS